MQEGQGHPFGTAPDGSPVRRAVLSNGGTTAAVMTWGASLQDFRLAGFDRSLVLGSPEVPPYLGPMRHFGAIVGRVANRIAGGRAVLDGQDLTLERNENGRTTLHGGATGTSVSNWQLDDCDATSCRLSIRVPDGAGGFPGTLDLAALYRLGEDGALTLEIEGRTDAPTFCNPAHHSYWALTPRLADLRLRVDAERYLPVDADKIPLGPPAPVAGTRFDFRTPRRVTGRDDAPLDHNFCLTQGGGVRFACRLEGGPLRLDIATDAPGVQVYDGAGIDSGDAPTHTGKPYRAHAGVAIEPQGWPDAPNHAEYPQITLRPGETFHQVSRFHVTAPGRSEP